LRFSDACIPLGGAWSSPFCRWQGPLSGMSSLDVAADVTRRALAERGVPADQLTQVVLGWTVPQPGSFYGASTLAGMIGAPGISGPMVAQACATSAAAVAVAATSLEPDELTLVALADRISNGPHIVWPSPGAQGGKVRSEDFVLENFRRDPWAGEAMVATAEAVAREGGFTREQIDELTLMRYRQYARALQDDRAFQRRYMVGVEVRGELIDEDSGVRESTPEGLRALEPVSAGGVITYGSQTHPADGAAGVLVTGERRARELGRDGGFARVLAFGSARVEKARMPKAPVPAAQRALADAGLKPTQIDLVSTHNPFAVNDLWLSQQLGLDTERMNQFGSSLIYGHPQGPTGARALAELIEALALRGGGTGLFTGCAAGDTGAALVVRVEG
jgi:acetyl-CoA acetyltransferase family protein